MFLYLLYVVVIILGNTLLTFDEVQPIPAETDTTFNLEPVTDNITHVVVAPIIITVSTDSIIQVSVL